ncbi:uncharacterized protein LOC141620366 [Silene latifolia]|uniref:uncharacterized protein LOC141620366 n=1 Tax=Silene latifolia TaxID=37657 RepID=UPI003D77DB31
MSTIPKFYHLSWKYLPCGIRKHTSSLIPKFFVTFIYAFNSITGREELCKDLRQYADRIHEPWAMGGDFNCVTQSEERMGTSTSDAKMAPFIDCLNDSGMIDIQATRAYYTWSNKQKPTDRVYSRLDRFMLNQNWMTTYPTMFANFLSEGVFDHCPCVVKDSKQERNKQRSFKYMNMWGEDKDFLQIIFDIWQNDVSGHKMFQILKLGFKGCNRSSLAKVSWLKEGDANTTIFHRVIKSRRAKNTVIQIEDMHGKECSDKHSIQIAFLEYYNSLLGMRHDTLKVRSKVIQTGRVYDQNHWDILLAPATDSEIKETISSIPNEKSPGPDGFFINGKLLKQPNATNITLIPKVDRPSNVLQFRPVACCNVLYKRISKILSNRLSKVLPELICQNQGGFVKGKSIMENILIYQDLIRLYNKPNASPRCMFKIDLQKACDTVEWDFLDKMLQKLNFPPKFRDWIMKYVTTPTFSLNLNWEMFGFFKGKIGLRKGDPISPLLFTMCMEYLSRTLIYTTENYPFKFHPKCAHIKLCHIMFAKDLLLFCKGDKLSIMSVIRAFGTFSKTSGLKLSPGKSNAYFNGMRQTDKDEILKEGGLGIRNITLWNIAAMNKLTWWVCSRPDKLWVQWVHHIYLKGANWDEYKPTMDSSWSWRKICQVKDTMRQATMQEDWTNNYKISQGYNALRKIKPVVHWLHQVWTSWAVPKHRLIAWLIFQNALNTRIKLYRLGVCDRDSCCICEQQP